MLLRSIVLVINQSSFAWNRLSQLSGEKNKIDMFVGLQLPLSSPQDLEIRLQWETETRSRNIETERASELAQLQCQPNMVQYAIWKP